MLWWYYESDVVGQGSPKASHSSTSEGWEQLVLQVEKIISMK